MDQDLANYSINITLSGKPASHHTSHDTPPPSSTTGVIQQNKRQASNPPGERELEIDKKRGQKYDKNIHNCPFRAVLKRENYPRPPSPAHLFQSSRAADINVYNTRR